ncbi:hypothetical protein FAZ95_13865 [Trinickia violacea]|uniref:Uncharacterized protein n=1 Tax=Trinickia violacea TaxID=2571746 RepID=A0A4V1EHG3_9BURK|nr:hypothetical protein [Trinickia violacea]QCP50170.1 hypothetical protein FAZ95_13865 [Trinickia violacea]
MFKDCLRGCWEWWNQRSFKTKCFSVLTAAVILYSPFAPKPTPKPEKASAEQHKEDAAQQQEVAQQQEAAETQEKVVKEAAEEKTAQDAKETEDLQNKGVLLTMRAVKQTLRDPDSVQWIEAGVSPDMKVVCVTFRARNGFGGMDTGFGVFAGGRFSQTEKVWNTNCHRDDLVNKSNVVFSVNNGYASVD